MSARPFTLAALARQWRLLAVLAILGGAGGAAYGAVSVPEYSSTSQVLVALRSDGSTTDRLQGASYVDSVLATYTSAVTSSVVLQPVGRQLGLDSDLDDLRRDVTATSTTGTALITITASGTSASGAQELAAAVTRRFVAEAPRIVSPVTDTSDAALQSAGLTPAALSLTVVDAADLPESPDTPGFVVTVLLGIIAGLLVAAAVAFLRQAVDGRVRDDAEIAETAGAPVLGHLPVRAGRRGGQGEADAGWTEAVRGIRSALFAQDSPSGRIVQVTAAGPGDGATTTALALGRSLARSGRSVLLVDADLRTPSVHDHLGLPLAPGLADAVAGSVDVDALPRPVGDGLLVLTAGSRTGAAGDLVASTGFAEFLRTRAAGVDVTLVDTPSATSVADARAIAGIADDVVLVVATGATTRAQVAAAAADLASGDRHLVGVVVTSGRDERPRWRGRVRAAAVSTSTGSIPTASRPASSGT